ncbi:TCR/Tet family MFS transporter [Radicibacter daui]|uniref:TCR/Tet family MFS transporter n=1 Tax=Radicibacter daui TaxID=3064829 RepID=UPI004046DE65
MDRRLIPVLATVLIDGMGLALVVPVLPGLLRSVGHLSDLSWLFGAFLGLYALMQFLASPLLGTASDRFGRRPVLLLSLAGAVADYLFMALAPSLALLFLGRAIAGITSASLAIASAAVADITPEAGRTRRFGQLSAAMGLGFIVGPALGGLVGGYSVRAPFLVAALMAAANLALALLFFRETKPARPAEGLAEEAGAPAPVSLNPLAPLRWALSFPVLAPLLGAFILLCMAGQVPGALWVLYGEDRFGWLPVTTGLSLAVFGLFHALIQAFAAGRISRRWGDRVTLVIGMLADATAYLAIAFATRGTVAFALLPFFCLGGIAMPALQSLLSGRVKGEAQGRLQGVLASLNSLVSSAVPLAISAGYFAARQHGAPGLVWIGGAALYLPCLVLVLGRMANPASRPGPARP